MYHESKIVVLSKSLTQSQVLGFALIFFLILGLGGSYYVISQRQQELQKNSVTNVAEVQKLTEDKERMGTYLKRYESSIDEFKKILFKQRDVSLFLNGISDISQKNNVSVVSIKNLPEKTIAINNQKVNKGNLGNLFSKKDLSMIIAVTPLKISIEGKIDDVLSVLGALEQTKQLLTISQFDFKTRDYPRMNVDFQINLYGLGDKDSNE
ncbi:MAG: hypothetical protein PHY73_08275 [Candidatus Omnitrophica bacterium]|nr:hypothetical protein [Candidatus Omnitrophota bacterium]